MTASRTMPAAVIAGPGKLRIEPVSAPRIRRSTDVLLDVTAAGVCGTDLHLIRDPVRMGVALGTVLGHEFVGVVRDAGDAVTHVRPGDRVVVEPSESCGACANCRRGYRHLCRDPTVDAYGFTRPGGFAPRVVVSAANAHQLAPDTPDSRGALVEPLSSVVHGVRLARPFPGERALVIGAGPIGLLFAALLTLAGLDVVVSERPGVRAEAARRLGAIAVLEPGDDTGAAVRELTGGYGADVVVDTVGKELAVALEAVRDAGRIVLFGVARGSGVRLDPALIQSRDVQLLGANIGTDVFAPALRLVEQGRLELEPLISHRVALSDLPAAVELQQSGRATKVLVQFSE